MDGRAPRRIETERFLLRRYQEADAKLVKDAIDSSLDHLRPFIDWAWAAPEPLGVIEERLALFGAQFDSGEQYAYGMFSPELYGGAGLHPRAGPNAFDIGYFIRSSRLRQGLATEAAAVMTHVGFEHCGVEHLELQIDPANTVSCRIPVTLGYEHEATLKRRLPPCPPGGPRRDLTIWTLFTENYPGSPAARIATAVLGG